MIKLPCLPNVPLTYICLFIQFPSLLHKLPFRITTRNISWTPTSCESFVFSVDHLMGKLKSLGFSSWVNAEIFPKSRRWIYLYVLLLYKKIWVCPQDRRVSPGGYCNSVRMKEIMSWHDHGSKFCNYNIFITSTEDSINVAFVKNVKKRVKNVS